MAIDHLPSLFRFGQDAATWVVLVQIVQSIEMYGGGLLARRRPFALGGLTESSLNTEVGSGGAFAHECPSFPGYGEASGGRR